MSTVVVVKKNGLIAIAADTLTKAGSTRETADYVVNHEKIVRVQDNYLALAGPTSMKLILKNYFATAKARIRLDTVDNILKTWLQMHAALKEDYFMNSSEDSDDSFESSQADTVIANKHGIFGSAPIGWCRSFQNSTPTDKAVNTPPARCLPCMTIRQEPQKKSPASA